MLRAYCNSHQSACCLVNERNRNRDIASETCPSGITNSPKRACAAPCSSSAGFAYSVVTRNLHVTLTLFPFTVADSTSTLLCHSVWNLGFSRRAWLKCHNQRFWTLSQCDTGYFFIFCDCRFTGRFFPNRGQ